MDLPQSSFQNLSVNDKDKLTEIRKTPFVLFQTHFNNYSQMGNESLQGVQQQTILSRLFFHPKNLEILQKMLIMDVFRKTNGAYLIPHQNQADLQIVMRSMFLQHARHSPDQLTNQIRELNNIVVDDIVPNIITEILAYNGYLERAFGKRQILDRPECISNAGTKTLPSSTRV